MWLGCEQLALLPSHRQQAAQGQLLERTWLIVKGREGLAFLSCPSTLCMRLFSDSRQIR